MWLMLWLRMANDGIDDASLISSLLVEEREEILVD